MVERSADLKEALQMIGREGEWDSTSSCSPSACHHQTQNLNFTHLAPQEKLKIGLLIRKSAEYKKAAEENRREMQRIKSKADEEVKTAELKIRKSLDCLLKFRDIVKRKAVQERTLRRVEQGTRLMEIEFTDPVHLKSDPVDDLNSFHHSTSFSPVAFNAVHRENPLTEQHELHFSLPGNDSHASQRLCFKSYDESTQHAQRFTSGNALPVRSSLVFEEICNEILSRNSRVNAPRDISDLSHEEGLINEAAEISQLLNRGAAG